MKGKNGKVVKVDNWGKKSLAYKIKKFRDGYYVVLTIEGDGATIAELERRFRVTDYVIRFISVRIDEDLKRSEKIKAARQKKALQQGHRGSAEPDSGPRPRLPCNRCRCRRTEFTEGRRPRLPGPNLR